MTPDDAVAADTVWYVAYGSNLCRSRLQRYLDRLPGGTPLDDRAATVPHRLFFAHDARTWGGGGSAFLDPAPSAHATRARAWRLTRAQFLGVLAQENGRDDLDLDHEAADRLFGLHPGDTAVAAPGRYGLVLGCDSPDHRPALTFTTAARPLPHENAPSERYVATIVDGLVDAHGLTEAEARAYLSACVPEH